MEKCSASNDDAVLCKKDSELTIQEKMEKLLLDQTNMWKRCLQKYSYDEFVIDLSTETRQLESVTLFVETHSAYLKRYIINLLKSHFKGDGEYEYWRKLILKELKQLREKIESKYIIMYIDNIIPPFNHECLINKVENECNSKLKSLIQMRTDNVKPEEECRILIEEEWKSLARHISQKFICAYCIIFFGNPLNDPGL